MHSCSSSPNNLLRSNPIFFFYSSFLSDPFVIPNDLIYWSQVWIHSGIKHYLICGVEHSKYSSWHHPEYQTPHPETVLNSPAKWNTVSVSTQSATSESYILNWDLNSNRIFKNQPVQVLSGISFSLKSYSCGQNSVVQWKIQHLS